MIGPDVGFYVGAAVPVAALGWVYRAGAIRRADIVLRTPAWRHAAFAAGLALFFLSVEWPFARWAHELFFVHQIGIMIARIVSPILIVVARPAGLLIAGLPRGAREALLRPGLSDRRVQAAWRVLASAPVAMKRYVIQQPGEAPRAAAADAAMLASCTHCICCCGTSCARGAQPATYSGMSTRRSAGELGQLARKL